ncbi:MAG: Gfo/Idh/MocA family oxidoreductase [Thermodesulfovibrionales bacterium]|nr:Gfo/Idh/MocA family oxidoreductase [Thermodesulfovibrionales bacterium]
MPIKVGVIGTGYLGRHHARIYSEIEGAELVALIDTDLEKAKKLADEYNCKAYSDYRDIIDKLDAVSIVTPTIYHHKIALDCLKAGKDLLVEKPITVTVSEADELISEAEKRKLILQVGHLERYNPAVLAVSGMIKEPRFLEAERLSPFLGRGIDVDITLDLMIHDIDIILSFVSSPVIDIKATGASVLTDTVDVAKAWLEFGNGCAALLTASRLSPEKQRRLKIYQKDSYLSVDYQTSEVRSYFKKAGDIAFDVIQPEKKEPLKEELIDFVNCIKRRNKPKVSGTEGRNALKIALDITEKIKNTNGEIN